MAQPIIELKNLTKRYGDFTAVNQLNLCINKGEVFGLLGPNGAGKSTTILMMLGLSDPSGGTVKVCGIDATRDPISVKKRVGYMPDDIGFYENYTGLENLIYTAKLNGLTQSAATTQAQKLLERVGLHNEANKKTGKYSRGMRQRLGLADVFIKNPEVIVLDEPTLGIDPQGVREFLDLIIRLSREEGITVLLSSHHLHQVQQVCDRVGLFVGGKLLAEGDIPQLSAQLFGNEAFTVSVKVQFDPDKSHAVEFARLTALLTAIKGVLSVQQQDAILRVSCSEDVASEIARTIVANGFALKQLYQKEYGLDEIYHRYFEGKERNGKAN